MQQRRDGDRAARFGLATAQNAVAIERAPGRDRPQAISGSASPAGRINSRAYLRKVPVAPSTA